MKNKTFLIISREYLTRIQKKSFIIITILMPILLVAMIVLPVMLVMLNEKNQFSRVLVVDESEIFINNFQDNNHFEFSYRSGDIEQIKKEAFDQDFDVVLQILDNSESLKSNIYYKKNLPSGLESEIESQMDDIFFNQLLQDSLHIDRARYDHLQDLAKSDAVTIQIDEKGGEKEHDSDVNQLFGMACGMIIYFIIIIFASQVLRGVLEEKTNRIVEVLISSVKPMQLLIGKIVGIALVGLTQLVIWIALSAAILVGIQLAVPSLFTPDKVESASVGYHLPDSASIDVAPDNIFQMIQNYFSVSFGTIIFAFIFFFVVGYLIYSTLYAATGSVVDNESDSQQYTMPITIPLILAIVFVPSISTNPDGPLAFWLSMIPLTSPVAMMVRLPSGVHAWELLLSMGIALAFLVFCIWFAAKVYRIGIMTYGKKPSWKTIFKWLREK